MKSIKRPTGKNVMDCINFNFGKKHYIVAEKQGNFKFFVTNCVLSVSATNRIIKSLLAG